MGRSSSGPPNGKKAGTGRGAGEAGRASRRRTPRVPECNFRVYIGEVEIGVLSVSPLHLNDGPIAGERPVQTVVLRRAVDGSRVFHEWQRASASGKPQARTVAIELLSAAGGEPLHRWELTSARPVRWSGPGLNALSGELAMEELEITYESIEWTDLPPGRPPGGRPAAPRERNA